MAFTETAERAEAVRAAAADHRLRRCRVAVHEGGLEAAAATLATTESPDLLILETHLEASRLLQALDALSHAVSPETRVVVLGRSNDIGLYRALLGMGVTEYLFGSVTGPELAEVVVNTFIVEAREGAGRLIAVYGTRGGVGTSTVAVNLAHALGRETDEDVLLVDLDIAFGTSALALNLNPRQSVLDALAQPDRLDDVLLERFKVTYDDRLSLLAAPGLVNGAVVQPSSEALDMLFGIVRRDAAFVVLDLPHVWTDWVYQVLLDANELVLVTYPDLANLRDARNLMERLGEARGVQAPARIVFNREGASRKGELTAKDFEESLGTKPALSIPYEPALFGAAMNNGEPVLQTTRNGAVARAFVDLAWLVSGRDQAAAKKKKKGKGLSLASLFRKKG